jgi:phosphatidylglycerophosphatase A
MQPLVADFFGGTEIVLILAVVVLLFGVATGGGLQHLFGNPTPKAEEAAKATDAPINAGASLILWLSHGFGIGRIPVAPGTFGSLVGLLWFALLLSTQTVWGFAGGLLGGAIAAVAICGKAEAILQQRDPGSIVLDEICAMPLCFVPWLASEWLRKGAWPGLETFFGAKTWYVTAIIFVLFRVFDIVKPWPVRQSQKLPGGWGVVTDDVLAALYVCALSLIVFH